MHAPATAAAPAGGARRQVDGRGRRTNALGTRHGLHLHGMDRGWQYWRMGSCAVGDGRGQRQQQRQATNSVSLIPQPDLYMCIYIIYAYIYTSILYIYKV